MKKEVVPEPEPKIIPAPDQIPDNSIEEKINDMID